MIIYHPAYDVNHCSYRILNILYALKNHKTNCDLLKIINFYYVYPHLIKRMKSLPRPLNYKSKVINSINEPFELTPIPSTLFFEMISTHEASIQSLLQKSLIYIDENEIFLEITNLPKGLIEIFQNDEFNKSSIFKILVESFPKTKLDGENGLKSKSGLMEYKYD
ncbi:ABC-three component system middle component 5 [Pseudoalteromonas ostreae]|uniref:ABC-three component system middle component 5 n=1 Tax=Pseudoalteromonas ostreae TaxID=2774154 RepID=UPI0030843042